MSTRACQLVWLVAASASCAGTRATPEPAISAVPCTVQVPGTDVSEWRQVETRDFSICLPSGWHRYSAPFNRSAALAGGWASGNDTLDWAVGPFDNGESGPSSWEPNDTLGGRPVALTVYWSPQPAGYEFRATWAGLYLTGRGGRRGSPTLLRAIAATTRFRGGA